MTGAAAPERTGLAWSRTALGVLGNAALLAVRMTGTAGPGRALVPAVLAVALAVAVVLVGRHRNGVLRRPAAPSPRIAVPLIGWSVAALAVVTGAFLLL